MGDRQHANGRVDRFTIALAAIAVVGLLLRLGYVVLSKGNTVGGDGRYYHLIAGQLADGKGFIAPQSFAELGVVIPSAPHPPAWPLALTLLALVGLRGIFEQQLFACLVGTATIVMIGYAGRRVGGARVGLIAALIAALYPNFWMYERELMSETLTLFGVALLVYCAYRFLARPTLPAALAMGAACGLLALTHADALLLVVVLTVPLVLVARSVPARSRVRWAAAAGVTTAVLIAPWAIYNSARFHAPVLLGTEFGVTVAISNCEPTYHGKFLGFQEDACSAAAYQAGKITGDNEARRDNQLLSVGLRYATEHPTRALVAIAARQGRVWGVFRPFQQMRFDESRRTRHGVILLGFLAYWMLLPLAIAGAFVLHRRAHGAWPLLTMFVVVAIAVAVTYGFTRFRAVSEVAIVLLAAVAIDALLAQFVANWRPARHPA